MNAKPSLERRLARFYEAEAPTRAPDWVLASALAAIDTTPQRRSWIRVPWRFPLMNGLPRVAAVIIAVVALALVGFAVLSGSGALPNSSQTAPSASPASPPSVSPTGETASTFRQPFTYVLPSDVQVDYGPRTSTFWEFRVPDSGGVGQAAWFLIVQAIEASRADPCSIESAEVPLADARAAMDYLKTVPTLSVTEEAATEVDGHPALSATLTFESPTAACPELSPWSTDVEGLPEPFRDPVTEARITLVTVDGETIAITTLATREPVDWFRWADEIIESIHFQP